MPSTRSKEQKLNDEQWVISFLQQKLSDKHAPAARMRPLGLQGYLMFVFAKILSWDLLAHLIESEMTYQVGPS